MATQARGPFGEAGGVGGLSQHNQATDHARVFAVQQGNQIVFVYRGRPPYAVAPMDFAPVPVHRRASQQPSWLLAARSQLVPWWSGRDDALELLRVWRDDPQTPIGVRLLHGAGGQGKTRLTTRFAELSTQAGWAVAEAIHASQLGYPVEGEQHIATDTGLLIVVDYGERWPTTDLLGLVAQHRLAARRGGTAGPATRLRVLVLARPAGQWWQSVIDALDRFADPEVYTDKMGLRELAQTRTNPEQAHTEREEVFAAARDRFAKALGVVDAAAVRPPRDIDAPSYGRVLTVHMAALAAVHAHASGARPPTDRHGLAAYLLRRERQEWQAIHVRDPNFTEPAVMAQAVYTATLTRPLRPEEGRTVLGRVEVATTVETQMKILRDHAVCYPPADPTTVLEPLYPDRLGEDFLALQTPGHDLAYPADHQWGPTAISRLLDTGDPQRSPGYAQQAMVVLVETACRWPHMARHQLWPLLRRRPELATTAGAVALSRLLDVPDVDLDALRMITTRLTDPPLELVDTAIKIAEAVLDRGREGETPANIRAGDHFNLGRLRYDAGRLDEARVAMATAADLYQQLYAESTQHCVDLANALQWLGVILADLGEVQQAREVAERAVQVWHDNPDSHPDHARDMADAFNSLGHVLSRVGNHDGSLAAYRKALDLFRQVPSEQALHGVLVAMALLNISLSFNTLSQWEEAKPYAIDSVNAYQAGINAGHRSAGRIGLSRALGSLAVTQWALGERTVSLESSRQAVEATLAWTEHTPAFADDLGEILKMHREHLGEVGRLDEALPLTQRSIDLWRTLADDRGLATAQYNLGVFLAALGRHDEAVVFAGNAVVAYQRLVAADRQRRRTGLSDSMRTLCWIQWQLGRDDDARATRAQALELHQHLPEGDRATATQQLSHQLAAMEWHADACTLASQAVAIRRHLASTDPTTHSADLATALSALGERLQHLGKHKQAHRAAAEAVNILRPRADADPKRYEPDLAAALLQVGTHAADLGRHKEAQAATTKAVEIYQRHLTTSQPTSRLNLAIALQELGGLQLLALERTKQAHINLEESLQHHRLLAESDPAYELALADALLNAGAYLSQAHRDEEGLNYTKQATQIYERLATTDHNMHPLLVGAFNNLADHLINLERVNDAQEPIRSSLTHAVRTLTPPVARSTARSIRTQADRLSRLLQTIGLSNEATELRETLTRASP
jgi:tetratricopeptide (TPR) repeat protein